MLRLEAMEASWLLLFRRGSGGTYVVVEVEVSEVRDIACQDGAQQGIRTPATPPEEKRKEGKIKPPSARHAVALPSRPLPSYLSEMSLAASSSWTKGEGRVAWERRAWLRAVMPASCSPLLPQASFSRHDSPPLPRQSDRDTGSQGDRQGRFSRRRRRRRSGGGAGRAGGGEKTCDY